MPDLHSEKDIEKISFAILRDSKSLDIFPTPVDKIIQYCELHLQKDADISFVHSSMVAKFGQAFKRAISKVRGMLDVREKTIYLDLTMLPGKKNFIKLHETGHSVLPWQSKIYDLIEDDDKSLNLDYTDEFEAEANYFASITLFQHDRFLSELRKLPLGIKSAMYLAEHFGASIHAALRRYVECSKKRCALFVLENNSSSFTTPTATCNIRNAFYSARFEKDFGSLQFSTDINSECPFVLDYYNKKRFIKDGRVVLKSSGGDTEFQYHFFFNGYNGFALLFPVGEHQSSRTNIIVSAKNI